MAEVARKAPVLPSGQRFFQSQHHAHRVHVARPRYGESLDDVLSPGYWIHQASLMRADDFVEVLPEGMEWYAKLVVIDASALSVKVKVLDHKSLVSQAVKAEPAGAYKADRVGRWWRVIRVADQSVMKSGLTEEAEALGWIKENTEA